MGLASKLLNINIVASIVDVFFLNLCRHFWIFFSGSVEIKSFMVLYFIFQV
jgi:hypothetical protein